MNRPFAETMSECFPEDIWVEILFRLPVKSLMLFKCVCKRWRSLISDPGFAQSHLQRLKEGDLIPSQRIIKSNILMTPLMTIDFEALEGAISDGHYCEPVELHCPHSPHDYHFWDNSDVVGSCDGLICLLVRRRFLIYNPATRMYRELPGSDFVGKTHLFRGFGYDSRSGDYKLVEGIVDYDNWEVEVFSLKSRSWRRIQVPFHEESHLEVGGPGVYWNGGIHWFVDYTVTHRRQGVIMSFDLSEEKFHRKLPVPEVNEDIVLAGIGIHGASLLIYNCGNDPGIEAWIMDEHRRGGSWTKWFSIDGMHPLVVTGMAPMAYTRSGTIVLQMHMDLMDMLDMEPRDIARIYMMNMEDIEDMDYMERMVLFNPEDQSWDDYPTDGELIGHAIYLETLVSPYLDIDPSRI